MNKKIVINLLLVPIMVLAYACNKPVAPNPTIGLKLRDSLYINMGRADSLSLSAIYQINYKQQPAILIFTKYSDFVICPTTGNQKGQPIYIPVLDSFVHDHQIENVCYYNEDSLWGYSREEKRIYLFNLQGMSTRSWRVNNNYKDQKNIWIGGGIYGNPISFDAKNATLYHYANAFPSESGYDFFHKPHALALQLGGDSAYISNMFSYYPNGYDGKYFGITLSSTCSILFGDRLYTSFYLSDSLYSYATDTPGKPAGQYNARSNYAVQPIDSFDITNDANKDYIMEFYANHFIYNFLTTAATSPYLFRIVDHKYHFYNEDSTINMGMQRPWSMVVLDTALQIKGEIPFLDQTFGCTNIIPVNNGFWINTLKDKRQFYFYEMEFK
jgi:hypothetical protein